LDLAEAPPSLILTLDSLAEFAVAVAEEEEEVWWNTRGVRGVWPLYPLITS
jgi:hypothetical protein